MRIHAVSPEPLFLTYTKNGSNGPLRLNNKTFSSASHRIGGNRKRSLQSTSTDQKSLTVCSIVICRQSDDKWQPKTLFVTIFDLRSTIVFTFSISAYPVYA